METDNPRPITNPVSSFNPLTHIPPKYDIYGRLKKQYNYGGTQYNILAEKDKIKIPWQNDLSQSQSTPMTRTKLIERRKKERIPDISYDLDKDGYVGGKDYVLAKRFDVDNDGKLNEKEKQVYSNLPFLILNKNEDPSSKISEQGRNTKRSIGVSCNDKKAFLTTSISSLHLIIMCSRMILSMWSQTT